MLLLGQIYDFTLVIHFLAKTIIINSFVLLLLIVSQLSCVN